MTPKEIVAFIKAKDIKMVDLKFMDFPGTWQHFSVPVSELTEDSFEEGYGFDGSSIRGWQPIHASDMLVIPDPATALIDPFCQHPTLSMICGIIDPITKENYSRDPRNIAQKAEAYLNTTGIADTVYFGPELEFFLFSDVRYDSGQSHSFYYVDSPEAIWNSGRVETPGNLAHKPRNKEGYFPVPPTDSLQDIRTEMTLVMEKLGLSIECQHHEVATGGQCEIDMRYDTLTKCGDNAMLYKYVVKNVARLHNLSACFMPKPVFDDNGSGMHTHQSLWKGGQPLFAGNGYGGLSDIALHYIGGILKHAASICAFAAPSTSSYKRLVPGFEAPVNLAYSSRNRSAAIRIPMYQANPKTKRLEIRFPDPSANGYLAFSSMLMAGLDGIENKIDPGEPLDKDIYALGPEELASVPSTPASLSEAIDALEKDHEYLMKGDVFTRDTIEMWIDYKRENEINPMNLRPHPYEFALYYDC